ncbi:MAG: class I SAM-dependent methyltransferase [Bacteroidales bacterium]|nr:class I SAM-dependent methyltransferase [Bacteroidales bacterium]
MEYWESRFKNEGAMWKFEPSDSAMVAVDLFKSNKINKILIPGFGYGRNAKLFCDNAFSVTGIELSHSAIVLAKTNGINCTTHHGSVTSMPFDNELYEGIFCYALIHLLNKNERRKFLESCWNQLKEGGIMFFLVASKQMSMYGGGKYLSKDRYEISKGVKVYFYDSESVSKEFADFGIDEFKDIEEPVKFMDAQEPIKLIQVICRK